MPSQDTSFARFVSLACHDLRTPLATVYGFARTIQRAEPSGETLARYVEMIAAASSELTDLLEELAVVARIEAGRYEPLLAPANTLELAREALPGAEGSGAQIETDGSAVVRSLHAFAECARKYGGAGAVSAVVDGTDVRLSPIEPGCAGVIMGDDLKDLGAAVAHRVVTALGGSVQLDGTELRISLATSPGS
ncbi:MAG: sensor histidine kinase [Gaiellaceae bacterium]